MNTTIFEDVQKADQNIEFLVKASYVEIYMEKIRDLLDRKFIEKYFFCNLRYFLLN
jgi:hypothetical protein